MARIKRKEILKRLQAQVEAGRPIVGFFGASSIERLPTEWAIQGQVQTFKSLPVAPRPAGADR